MAAQVILVHFVQVRVLMGQPLFQARVLRDFLFKFPKR